MFKLDHRLLIVLILILVLKLSFNSERSFDSSTVYDYSYVDTLSSQIVLDSIKVKTPVIIEDYFQYLDSIVQKYDSLTPYTLTEHLIVRANPWIIDTLQNTDYYRMKSRDSFVYNQKKMIVLSKGVKLIIPDSLTAQQLYNDFSKTIIDINIPEFKLRMYQDTILLYEFPVRVGKHQKKYLEMSGRIEDLRTKTGEGHIVDHIRNPKYANPVTNKEYTVTRRDDDKVTKLPQIPFIETEINGLRYGQLIHPTTNPVSLGKASSNGCIGTKEADAWVIYYYAPVGTKIKIRYNLNVVNKDGDSTVLKDIYRKKD
ncbi:L,D-transpeptidase [uncultured Psychroserpens sp.]|uniref:L,D-transpeptidase n=1 Tax=uncultured Psychroserpens sp. TaxID=255436 RepID=UPI0026146F04|nr:L,D-transpeptidase [uncultured Psychroserpens sp.]